MLVADDTATLRLLLRRTLEASKAFEVVGEAADGAEAVDLATSLQPDIVLLDLAMPVLDGMDAIPHIREKAPNTQIVVLSGYGPDGLGARAVEAGAAAFLEKTKRPGELVAALLDTWRSQHPDEADTPSPDRFRHAFEHAPVAMALVGADGRVLDANRAWCRLTGRTAEQSAGLTLDDLTVAEDQATDGVGRRTLVPARSGKAREARVARPDGRTVWASISSAPAGDGDGDADGTAPAVVTMVDVTEHRRVEREMARSNAELSSFAYLAAHELKSPLQALSGFAALLDRVSRNQLDAQGREFISWILDGAGRMNGLIEDLLAYCSVDRAEAVMGPVSLEQVLGDALNQLKTDVVGRGAVIDAGPLPVVTGDPVQLGQLLQNLVANALKFVPEGRPPRIVVSAERAGESWIVTVADNGIGVEDGARERIFGMFERLHPRERYKGTGIGLSMCKRIIERRGGTIWVEPNAPGGSRFCFSLPDVLSLPGEAPAA